MRGTGDKGEGRIMVEESALLVIGMKALKLKSFGFYSQENKCNFKRKWLRYIGIFGHSPVVTPHPLQQQGRPSSVFYGSLSQGSGRGGGT